MFESHSPFIEAVKSKSNEFSLPQILSFLDGKDDPNLSLAFGAWARGDPTAMQKYLDMDSKDAAIIRDRVNELMADATRKSDGKSGMAHLDAEKVATDELARDKARAEKAITQK